MEYYDPRDYDLAGRIAKLKTLHGVIETPYLFPVVDPVRQVPSIKELEEIGYNAFITNAYLYYRRNRGVVKSIHESFSWNKPIMTDSGGYQILLYGSVDIDNLTIIEYEKDIGVDIGVILDIPTGSKMNYDEAFEAVNETFKRAWEALPHIMDSRQLWVYPIQGAPYLDLLTYSAKKASRLPYHIYALGSPTLYLERYDYDRIVEYAAIARMNIPPSKPLHVFGVGHPMIISFLVALGADLFDSASYILYARDERLMFEWGTRSLDELSYLPCECPVCTRYSVEELREMSRSERVELIAKHNLYVLRKELDRVKQAIREGRLWDYIYQRSMLHPSLRRAFNTLKKYLDYLEKYSPETKTPIHALYLIGRESIYNPRIRTIYRKVEKLINNSVRDRCRDRVVLVPAVEKPFNQSTIYLEARRRFDEQCILFYHPYLGVFPPELSNTYPFFQHEIGEYVFIHEVVEFITGMLRSIKPGEITVFKIDDPVYHRVIDAVINEIRGEIEVEILDMH